LIHRECFFLFWNIENEDEGGKEEDEEAQEADQARIITSVTAETNRSLVVVFLKSSSTLEAIIYVLHL